MKKWGVLIVLSMSMFIIVIDTTIMNVSISALVKDLNTTVSGVQGAISLYALVMAAFMMAGGKLADILGKKKTFYTGIVLFGIGTGTAAISQNLTQLIIGWSVIEGLGSALMMPTLQNILRDNYSGKDRAFGYGVIGGVGAFGAAVGPIVGGFLTTYASWRWAFAFEVAVVIVVLSMHKLIKHDLVKNPPKFDFGGFGLIATAMTLLVLGVNMSSIYGWWSAKQPFMFGSYAFAPFGVSIVPFMIMAGLLVYVLFYQHVSRRRDQGKSSLIDPQLMDNKVFKNAVYVRFLNLAMQASMLYVVSLFLQMALGLSSFATGLVLLPFSIAIIFASVGGTKLVDRYISRTIIKSGFLISIGGLLLLIGSVNVNMGNWDLTMALVAYGLGMGLIASQLVNLVLSTVKPAQVSEATGYNSTYEQLGNAIGVALIGSVLLTSLNTNIAYSIQQSEIIPENIKVQVASSAQLDIQYMSDTQAQQALVDQPEDVSQELLRINAQARVAAFQQAILVVAFLGLLAFILSRRLPNTKLA